MAAENQMEKLIVESVMKELARRGLLGGSPAEGESGAKSVPVGSEPTVVCSACSDEEITLPDISEVWVPQPANLEALQAMKKATPARIGLYRAGARPKTGALLRFMADHAVAQDAVFLDVSEEFLKRMNLFSVQTAVKDQDEFLKRPDLGRKLSEEAKKTILEKCKKNVQVQILVVDGLSSTAIEANVPEVLPVLIQGLTAAGIEVGTPFFVKYGRVGVQDQVGMLLNAEVVISLIGERPGLASAESMSAYIIYRPTEKTVEADRTMISNIHRGGTPPAEAGAHLVDLIKQVLAAKASGINLTKA
ncbi:ethanolamine ammonia-lyase subunit EutC [Zhaonella formicivorans]|uniref:ethanolamine ammonia-lyase subunit EutC n=1 Tax=Zhaonella formicivorans TaxID=2528593 RepID=UPI001D10638A|nr:ethanolamine ammonia-lyase subunit EutC [Zhaonella formicivorans]